MIVPVVVLWRTGYYDTTVRRPCPFGSPYPPVYRDPCINLDRAETVERNTIVLAAPRTVGGFVIQEVEEPRYWHKNWCKRGRPCLRRKVTTTSATVVGMVVFVSLTNCNHEIVFLHCIYAVV